MVVNGFEGQVYVTLARIYAQNLADDLLSLSDEIPDVFYPSRSDIPDVNESLLVVVFVERHERSEVLDTGDSADDELSVLGEASGTGHQFSTSRTSPFTSPWPPVERTRVAPHVWHATVVAGLLKTICSFPQSAHLTLMKLLAM